MGRHEMVERDDFFNPASPMTQEESRLPSEDVWLDMVDALRNERIKDLLTEDDVPISRGRHHKVDA